MDAHQGASPTVRVSLDAKDWPASDWRIQESKFPSLLAGFFLKTNRRRRPPKLKSLQREENQVERPFFVYL
jgi:hypothetical protein